MLSLIFLLAFPMTPARAAEDDPFLWLEEVQSPKAMDWVKAHNEKSVGLLTKGSRYAKIEDDVRRIVMAKDRIPMPSLANGWIYNFWQDAEHVRGMWRRCRPEEYAKSEPKWDVLLDIDRLNKEEGQDWVWHGAACLPPAHEDCLVYLSHGGKDASVVREFDVARATWVAGGFTLPEAKTSVSWLDSGRVFVGTDYGPGSMTESGYPRIVKLWTRGQALSQAKTVFEGEAKDVSAHVATQFRPEGAVTFVTKQMTFWTAKHWVLQPDLSLKPIPFPDDVDFQGVFQGQLLAILRSDWKRGDVTLQAGALVYLPLASLWDARPELSAGYVWVPDDRSSVVGVSSSKDFLFLDVLMNVQGRVLQVTRSPNGAWGGRPVHLPSFGMASVRALDDFDTRVYFGYEGFLEPTTLYSFDSSRSAVDPQPVKSLPARFDAKGLKAEQFEAVSADSTKIPYFLVHREGLKLDGSHPTILYGYGGFEIPMTPAYLNDTGKVWLEAGGVYALANIRGGGEFGPKWHEAALKENRQRAFDDFIAVAEDLIRRQVTSPRRLGIMGGSNGGLLVGATFIQRPELFHAVVCQVPLLDMLRYTKIAAGPSWVGEYGDPSDPKMADVIRRYSPYQNIRREAKYPEVFFLTSTKDDRVGPVHARKMAARLEAAGHPALYWENIEGGHGAAADLEERVKMKSLQYAYLLRQLAD
ncbi:MAG: prolyl oligopeptidase family serine peptidase [Elusimicrobia bacterium]|nr:prolyl oligopeptidase family serine peptidase [Elusimicrobiota bacterium]